MDYQNENMNGSLSGNSSIDGFYRLDEDLKDAKSKLLECESKCESTIMEICDVNQLKDKGTFVLKDVTRKYKDLDKELYNIHCNYAKCVEKMDCCEEYIDREIDSLTLRRDNLRKELSELKRNADENGKMLMEIRKKITIQEKKNTALIRKLRRLVENMHITPNLEDRINNILNDPRANTKISK